MRYTRNGASAALVGAPYLIYLLAVALPIAVAMVVGGFASTEADAKKRRGLHCGKVLHRSITLHRDIKGCKVNGLVAGRSGITIDLNGHTLGGLGDGVGLKLVGVRGVRVRGGTVRGFEIGMLLHRARRIRVVRTRIRLSSDVGLRVVKSRRSAFRRIRLSGNSDAAVQVFSSNRNRFRRLKLKGNGDAGIRLSKSHGNRLKRNEFDGNGDAGILLEYSHGNRIRRNNAAHSSDSGIALMNSSFNVVAGNRAFANGEGITADGGKRNRIVRNRANRNGGAGIEVGAESARTLVKRNVLRWNGADGAYIEGARTKLVRNRATCNGGMGIKAVVPLVYSRRNRAAGNNDAKGCEGVRCLGIPRHKGCGARE